MRNALRTFVVGLMIVGLTVNPAVAWHCCGGGYYSSYAPVYYGYHGGYGGYGCGGCGGCGFDYYDDCGGCGGCDSCGPGDGCSSCGDVVVDEGVVVEHGAESAPREAAPQPPAEAPTRQPATVDRPADTEAMPPAAPPESTFTPPAERPPAEAPAETPSDLFGPTETPADMPAETPPATEPAAPAETPATPPAEDDLFGGESTDTAPAATDAAPSETPTTPPAETPATPPAEGETTEEDDLFGQTRGVLREAGGLDSSEMRVWVDDTGKYSVNARLIRFIDGHVRLMKDTGRTTTVPLNRLSARDLEFVNRQASAQKATTMQTAQAEAPSFRISN